MDQCTGIGQSMVTCKTHLAKPQPGVKIGSRFYVEMQDVPWNS